jgi:hypothetical protein
MYRVYARKTSVRTRRYSLRFAAEPERAIASKAPKTYQRPQRVRTGDKAASSSTAAGCTSTTKELG